MHRIKDYPMNLQLFATTQTTAANAAGNSTAAEMKTFYEKRLIDYAEPALVHDQFGDAYPIPENGGKSIEFRKFSPLGKALTPITEGVTPNGNKLNVSSITGTVQQYGDFIELSDMLELTAFDPMIEQTVKIIADQAGRTLDTITREVLNGGTQVIYAPIVSGDTVTETDEREELTANAKLTPDVIFKAAAQLKAMNAKNVDDSYVAIIHPYAAYDLMRHKDWLDWHKYADAKAIYRGEIGKIGGVRFVESTEAKIIAPKKLLGCLSKNRVKLQTNAASGATTIKPDMTITAAEVTAFASVAAEDKYIYVKGTKMAVSEITAGAPGTAAFTVAATSAAYTTSDLICGLDAGADGTAVFSTVVLGANAYGKTELEGGGLETIIKQKGSAGTADPLNQRSTVGWKATKTTERLVEEYMIRIESGSSYSATAESN